MVSLHRYSNWIMWGLTMVSREFEKMIWDEYEVTFKEVMKGSGCTDVKLIEIDDTTGLKTYALKHPELTTIKYVEPMFGTNEDEDGEYMQMVNIDSRPVLNASGSLKGLFHA